MPEVTENTINDWLAGYLRGEGLNVATQITASLTHGRGRRTPDFELRNGAILYGEGEWFSSYEKGFGQAIEFGDIPGASGYFLIGYPDDLKERVRQRRIAHATPVVLLSGVTYRGIFKLKGEAPILFRGSLEEIPDWLRQSLARQPRPPDATEFVHLMRDIVRGLTDFLPAGASFPSLFEHIIASMPRDKGELETARAAAAYLLLNQVVFYRILEQRGYPEIRPEALSRPSDLKRKFFNAVLKDDYQAIYDFDVASLFPSDAIDYIRDMVKIVNELQPEQFTRDLLGNIFHALIPLEVRKPVAAYYTNPMAARLLAKLAVRSPQDRVADFACGSGTLLMAAYDRKAELAGGQTDEGTHRQFVEEDLTGLDIMPFAAHLAVVQLALRNPAYLTDRVRIAVYDSTSLKPGAKIRPLERVMPRGQASIHHFQEGEVERRKVREGAVSGAGAGRGFEVGEVDVVIMNPPFTRKQHVKQDFREMLTGRFEDYAEYASKEQNLFGYFVLLSDRFLQDGGRLAMVLPATVLRQMSSEGVRRLLSTRYSIEYIVQSGFRSAFSESTAFREILLVARKGDQRPGEQSVVAKLEAMPSEANVDSIAGLLGEAARGMSRSLKDRGVAAKVLLSVIDQEELRHADNWQRLLPGERIVGTTLPETPVLRPLKDVVRRVVQGIRFHKGSDQVDVKNTVVSRPRKASVKMNWRVERETADSVEIVSTDSGMSLAVPKTVLRPTTRSPAGMQTMEVMYPPDFIVTGRFPGDEAFWDDPKPDEVLARRLPHLKSRESFLVAAGRNNVDLAAPGTHFLAFVFPQPVPPTWSFWSVQTTSLDDARILALWWNSTFHLAQLLEHRAEVRGSWMGWLREDLWPLRVLDPAMIPPQVRQDLLATYTRWATVPFPPLLDQLKTHYEGRQAIDYAAANAIGYETPATLYEDLATRIESLRNMMSRD